MAGARIGGVLADPDVITVLRSVAAPYAIPAPSAALALAALSDAAQQEARDRIVTTLRERESLRKALKNAKGVSAVYPSEGNYLLVRFADADAALALLLSAGVVVRDMRNMAQLGNALRISVGSPDENQTMLAALQEAPKP